MANTGVIFPTVLQALRDLGPGVWHNMQIAEKAGIEANQVANTLSNHIRSTIDRDMIPAVERVSSGMYRLTSPVDSGSSTDGPQLAKNTRVIGKRTPVPSPVDTVFEKIGNVKGGILVRGDETQQMYVCRELEA